MSALWTAQEAAAATGGTAQGNWTVSGVSIDTRTLQPGDLFVALKAARDGHEFVAQALAAGASGALVTHVPDGVAGDAPLLIVPDVLGALEDLGRAARARTSAKVVAITGSVGKTSTKEMMRTVLERQGRTHAAEASYNNHWGVPLTLARMPADAEFAVIEIGMNHPGEIAPLARMARPDVAMITTVAAAHLEAFDSLEGIAKEKADIFEGLADGGVCVINGDLPPKAMMVVERAAWSTGGVVVRFGAQESCQYQLTDVTISGEATLVKATLPSGAQLFKISSPGRHFAANALGVLAVVEALGADVTLAARDVALWVPPTGRGTHEMIMLDAVEELSVTLIDDAFNANPTSMAASFEVLAASQPVDGVGRITKGRRVLVLGDMLELGGDEVKMHADLAQLDHFASADIVHCAGPLMKALWDVLPSEQQGEWFETAADLSARAHHLFDAGDVLLVKGSKGSKISLVVDAVRKMAHPLGGNS